MTGVVFSTTKETMPKQTPCFIQKRGIASEIHQRSHLDTQSAFLNVSKRYLLYYLCSQLYSFDFLNATTWRIGPIVARRILPAVYSLPTCNEINSLSPWRRQTTKLLPSTQGVLGHNSQGKYFGFYTPHRKIPFLVSRRT